MSTRNPTERRPLRAPVCLLVLWASALASGACLDKSDRIDPKVDSESHFLRGCDTDNECSDGRTCICHLCTTTCTDDSACRASLAPSEPTDLATCAAPGTRFDCGDTAPTSICVATCDAHPDCGAGFACSDHACVPEPKDTRVPIVIHRTGHVAITVAPPSVAGQPAMSVPHLSDACYDLWVTDGNDDLLWFEGNPASVVDPGALCSTNFGNGATGDIAYVGNCNADAPDSRVSVVLHALWDDATPPAEITTYKNPCPPETPCVLTFACKEGQDMAITFNLTLE